MDPGGALFKCILVWLDSAHPCNSLGLQGCAAHPCNSLELQGCAAHPCNSKELQWCQGWQGWVSVSARGPRDPHPPRTNSWVLQRAFLGCADMTSF